MGRSKSVVARWFVVMLGVTALAGGCSHAATPTTTTTIPASTSTTSAPTTSTTSTSSTTTTTTQPGPPSACRANQLALVALKGSGTAGSVFNPIGVVNKSARTCVLDGRPGITLIGGAPGAAPGRLATTVLTRGQASVFDIAPSKVRLPPGTSASAGFMVQSSDVPSNGQQACPVVDSMKVTLPGIPSAFTIAEKFTACGGPTISVSAIVGESELTATS